MATWKSRSAWLPGAVALLVAALGVAISFATDMKSNWIAWVVVGLLSVGVAITTAIAERRGGRDGRASAGTVVASASAGGNASRVYGLVMRSTHTANPDGSVTTVVDYFSEDLALQSLRENSLDESVGD